MSSLDGVGARSCLTGWLSKWLFSQQTLDSALHSMHNGSDTGPGSGFSPEEERRAKVQVSNPIHVTFTPLSAHFSPNLALLIRFRKGVLACVSFFDEKIQAVEWRTSRGLSFLTP